ncbi:MAG: futalosine hydrolase [Rubripirellula sp.]
MTDLILVPTPGELETIRPLLGTESDDLAFQVCGFGPIAAAARTAALISRYKASRVVLIGIAGSFDIAKYPVGSAGRFEEVACHGIGVGSGPDFQSATDLGWHQFSGGDDAQPKISDTIRLDSTYVANQKISGQLLTVCSASANAEEASIRRQMFPHAIAEDMEGFAVATACTLASVPLQIVRGISNQVGDRNHEHWQIEKALRSAAKLARRLMPQTWMPSEA